MKDLAKTRKRTVAADLGQQHTASNTPVQCGEHHLIPNHKGNFLLALVTYQGCSLVRFQANPGKSSPALEAAEGLCMSRRAMTGGRCGDLGAQEALSLLPALAAAACHLLRSHSAYSALPAPDLAPAITIAHWIWKPVFSDFNIIRVLVFHVFNR